MKEQLPAPDFNSQSYERPNQNWICGHACEGKPCRIGPDPKGNCRATYECQPTLELREGEEKGRFRCTRPGEFGGPCALGPKPDGTCGCPIAPCVPVRSLRAKRKIFTIAAVALTAAILIVAFCGPLRARFINPGPLSAQHSTETFAKLAGVKGGDANCAACHAPARRGPSGWLASAFVATPGPFQFHQLADAQPPSMNSIDQSCLACHAGHSFHEPNVVREHSCSACHREHQGSGLMAAPTDANCLSCHADAQVMQASFQKGKMLTAAAFDFRPDQGRVLFKAPRPERGYTRLIHSFATDHPEFQVLREKLRDPNTLKFNHALHLTSPTVSGLKGRALDCADCHKPDAAGVLHLKITYEENCASCHSLQFDVNNPGLRLPHGNAGHVRDFLRSLPTQYADFARQKGITPQREVDEFVRQQMKQIRERFASGEELEQRVFFSDARTSPIADIGNSGAQGAAKFAGCAYCHDVSRSPEDDAPLVSFPMIPDRWLVRGQFDHGKHFKVACTSCHDAARSRDTADVILPTKQSCVECHSPSGGVASSCSTCHSYHSPRKEAFQADVSARNP